MFTKFYTKILILIFSISTLTPGTADAAFKLFKSRKKYSIQPIECDLSSYEELIYNLEKLDVQELSLAHIGSRPILTVDLTGSFTQEIAEAKVMVVRLVDELLYRLNRDGQIRSQLKMYPLNETNIHLSIQSTNFQIEHLYHSLVQSISMRGGEVTFTTGGESPLKIEKTFDECIADNQQKNPHLDDKQWDSQVEDPFSSIEKQLKISLRNAYEDDTKPKRMASDIEELLVAETSEEEKWFSVGTFEPMIKEVRITDGFEREIQLPVDRVYLKDTQAIQIGSALSVDEVPIESSWFDAIDQPSVLVYERREVPESFLAFSYFGMNDNESSTAHLTPDATEGAQFVFANQNQRYSDQALLLPTDQQANLASWLGVDLMDSFTDQVADAEIVYTSQESSLSPFKEENIQEMEFDLITETFEPKSIQ